MQSKRAPPPAVTPDINASMKVKRFSVKFDLGRNSIAEYNKENPPNVVECLTSEVEDDESCTDGEKDDTTRRNEEILAEWETNFEDLGRASRRRSRRILLL